MEAVPRLVGTTENNAVTTPDARPEASGPGRVRAGRPDAHAETPYLPERALTVARGQPPQPRTAGQAATERPTKAPKQYTDK